jgi:hypothetical protein
MGVHIARTGQMRNPYNISVGKAEGKSPFGRCRSRRKDNTKMELREVECDDLDWIHLVQDSARWLLTVKTVMKHWIP